MLVLCARNSPLQRVRIDPYLLFISSSIHLCTSARRRIEKRIRDRREENDESRIHHPITKSTVVIIAKSKGPSAKQNKQKKRRFLGTGRIDSLPALLER